ncbi:putative galactolipase [Helianthus debilis subsp. tardiflorus]
MEGDYTTAEAKKWGLFGWWYNAIGSKPLVDIFTQASTDMVDFHLSNVFHNHNIQKNYLRIQVFFKLTTTMLLNSFAFTQTNTHN